MDYVHTYEIDKFYEVPQAAELSLPASIRAQMANNRNKKAKLRITKNSKTGEELAKIIKVRIADLDIFSPQTVFDYRISINLEMKYEGDAEDLVEAMEGGRRPTERKKDRLTYRHQAYQIDLTQVVSGDVGFPPLIQRLLDQRESNFTNREASITTCRVKWPLKRNTNLKSKYLLKRFGRMDSYSARERRMDMRTLSGHLLTMCESSLDRPPNLPFENIIPLWFYYFKLLLN